MLSKFIILEKGMNKKQLIVSGIGILVIAWWGILYNMKSWDDNNILDEKGSTSEISDNIEKQDFFIETKLWKDFWWSAVLEKTGKVVSQEDVTVSALANGKIKTIHVKEWQKIKKWAKLVSLEDSVASYWLSVEKSTLWIESAEIDYNTQKVNLEKNITDASIAVQKAKNSITDTKNIWTQNVAQAQLTLNKSRTDLIDTKKVLAQNIAQAQLAVTKSKDDLSDTKKVLEQNIAQADLALAKSKTDYEDTKKLLDQSITQSTLALTTSKKSEDTTFSVQMDKLKNNISKAELEVSNLKNANIEQLKSFKNSAISTYNSLDNLMIDIIDFSDTILWITENKKRLNDDYEDYLWIRNKTQLQSTEMLFREFVAYKRDIFDILDIQAMDFASMWQEDFEYNFRTSTEGYNLANNLLKQLTKVMDNTVVSLGSINQTQIDGFKAQINGYQSQTDQSFSWYGTYKSQVISFLNTYKNTEKAAEENLKLLQDEITILEKNQNITDGDLDTALQNNQINLERAKTDSEKTLSSLQSAITNNEISLEKLKIDKQKTINSLQTAIKNNEISLERLKADQQKTINSLQTAIQNNDIALKKLKIDNEKNIQDANIALKEANVRLDNAKKLKDITLKKMSNNIKLSKNTKNQANNEFSKLVSESWTSWVVSDIKVDVWQNVSLGTALVTISSLDNTKVEISLSKEERSKVPVWTKVVVKKDGKSIIWKIDSIWSVADSNLAYKTTVTFTEKFTTIWWLIDVQIPLTTGVALFPINLIEVTWAWKWKVAIMSGSTLEITDVTLWKVWGQSIEVTSKLHPKTQYIMTNLSNYDENRFILKKEGQMKEVQKIEDKQKNIPSSETGTGNTMKWIPVIKKWVNKQEKKEDLKETEISPEVLKKIWLEK